MFGAEHRISIGGILQKSTFITFVEVKFRLYLNKIGGK